ncbi:MAG: hypothetical protein IPN70_05320 [Candidatus Moraniibacteriota bacterium]|nr:MAG: hypothetical protein IPN70_05320 [Candidatus Moranbacteria bacterium]
MMFTKKNTPPKLQRTLDGIRKEKNNTYSIKEKKEISLSSFFSFLSKKRKLTSTFLLTILILGGVSFFFSKNIKGATYGWIQSSWIGGVTVNTATHTNNQENWTEFASKDANIQADASGVMITGTANTWVETTDSNFATGTNTGVYVSGTGTNADIKLLKPPGATCSTNTECFTPSVCSTTCLYSCSSVSSGVPCGFQGIIYSPITAKDGKVWLDRNLGATRVATAFNDSQSYGHYYQWGRGTDGHQLTTSTTTGTLSSLDTPGHGQFILAPSSPYDWRSPQNNTLWQGVDGTNNPCPPGFRLPTQPEWSVLVSAEGITDSATAYASTLKLSVAGYRHRSSGGFGNQGSYGFYWSSSVSGTLALNLYFNSGSVNPANSYDRANGLPVRCLKN